ncbi:MAG: hypothetical protein PHN44_00510 [Candidatus Marinimicrobia bacterium]|nr:hypothetical protein [Candidatus Neomarinimicrobiota bacterium]MDD5539062.1 hypothetical protein [Candidatus Neomarinimicrobiota bacterium]
MGNAKLYKWGSSHLTVLPGCLFWPVWHLWRSLTQSDDLRNARKEYDNAIKKEIEIERLLRRYPNDEDLKMALDSCQNKSMEVFRKLSAIKD